MKRSMFLKPGDRLGVCAPSARFDTQKLNSGVHILTNMGFKVEIPKEIYGKKRYLAGDDDLRADVINQLFLDPEIHGIICARGGFGAMRILNHLDWNLIERNPKPFIGFSDNTAILLSIQQKTGSPVVHGPNVVSLASAPEQTLDSFYKTLTGSFDAMNVRKGRVILPGRCNGILKGGNLATISHLIGTQFQPDFKDAVLFLEDIGEPAYKIDRMLTQMKMADLFEGIKGVLAGSFENCENEEYIEEILSEVFCDYAVPVLSGLDSGHGKINLSLCMGTPVEMDTEESKITWY